MPTSQKASRSLLKADGAFLALAGGAALIFDTVGHFWGMGPFAKTLGSPYTIGSFEAHGLALLMAILLLRAAAGDDRRYWHGIGIAIHVLLGGANLLFWSFFVEHDALPMGYITTVLHVGFVVGHLVCRR